MKSKIIWGLLILAVGIVLLLNATDMVPFKGDLDVWSFWPVLFIGLGLNWLVQKDGAKLLSIAFILAGSYWMAKNFGYDLKLFSFDVIVAIIVVCIAISILFSIFKQSNSKTFEGSQDTSDKDKYHTVFSEGKNEYNGDIFRSCNLSAVFGGSTFSLLNTTIDSEGAHISANVVFGGIDIIVPEGTNVITKGFIVFGGVDYTHKGKHANEATPGTLTVDVSGAFGGVEIQYI